MASGKCPECGTAFGKAAKFCKNCGQALTDGGPTSGSEDVLTDAALDNLEKVPLDTVSKPPAEPDLGAEAETESTGELFDDANPLPGSAEREIARFTVEILNGLAAGRKVRMNDGVTMVVGTGADADLVLNDECISRKHAAIHVREGKVSLEDLESTNGTFLRVERSCELYPNDVVVIGNTVLRIGKE